MYHSVQIKDAVGLDGRPFRKRRRPDERIKVLGGSIDLVKSSEVFHFAGGKIAAGERAIIANHNLHSLYLVKGSDRLKTFYQEADMIEVDSIPLIFWARLIGRPSRRFHRCTYLDWRDEFWTHAAERGWRVMFVGGAEGVGERAAEKIRECWPQVPLATHHGYFDITPGGDENEAVIETINAFAPDVLLVGMGMPRQEIWVLDNRDRLDPCVIFTVGGAFDYEAGVQAAAPRWLGRMGGEWMYRLLRDPRRLFTRYCVEPWGLVNAALIDIGNALALRITRFGARPKHEIVALSSTEIRR